MSLIYKGATSVVIPEYTFRQDDGLHYSYLVRGVPGDVIGKANFYKSKGYDTNVFHDGPYTELRVTNTGGTVDPAVQYIELWSVDSELIEKSLFTIPGAIAEAVVFPTSKGGRAGYKKKIETAASDKAGLDTADFPIGTYPFAHKIYQELMRGGSGYEHDYTVLTRTRNFSYRSPPFDMELLSNRYIYTTAQLYQLFSPPNSVKFSLPADTAANPDQAMWGWRVREQGAEITNATTGQHRTSWVYAAWSTFLYTPYGS